MISRIRRSVADPAHPGRQRDLVDEIPVPPESTGLIIDRGLFMLVITPVDSPLIVVEPVPVPGTLRVSYHMRSLEENHSYILPDVPLGTFFVMPDALPQVLF